MAILDGIKRQLRSVIKWEDPDPGVLFYQWTDNGDELKNASKLVVGPGQGCIFVYEGQVKDVITTECLVNLKTDNIPFWTTITKVMQFFESEHKAQIFFFRKAKVLDQKWGTANIIKYEDSKYKFIVGLRAYGNYSFKIVRPEHFFVSIVGSASTYTVNEFYNVMNDRIVQPLSDYFAESKFTYTEIDAKREEIAHDLKSKIGADFENLGFELTDFRIEGTNFDEDTMQRINRIADIKAEAHAASSVGLKYDELQKLDAMRDAAKNEGGGAGMGMGLGAGMSFGQMLAGSMNPDTNTKNDSDSDSDDQIKKLTKLKKMFEAELITKEEYTAKKQDILDKL